MNDLIFKKEQTRKDGKIMEAGLTLRSWYSVSAPQHAITLVVSGEKTAGTTLTIDETLSLVQTLTVWLRGRRREL